MRRNENINKKKKRGAGAGPGGLVITKIEDRQHQKELIKVMRGKTRQAKQSVEAFKQMD